eukprot:Polyplicarium_translucidae@DN2793_c0_g1_i1.p1
MDPGSRVTIDDPDDTRLDWYRLKQKRDFYRHSQLKASMLRENRNYVLAPTTKVVDRCLTGLHEVVSVLGTARVLAQFGPLLENVSDAVLVATKETIEVAVGAEFNHEQACCAVVDLQIREPRDEDFSSIEKPVLIFDDVRSSENIGSIARTAHALGIDTCFLSRTTASACNARAARVSMGSLFHLRLIGGDVANVLRRMREHGVCVIGTSPSADIALRRDAFPRGGKLAILVGNEEEGASETNLALCTYRVCIPQVGGDSLSVQHAAAIAIFELTREDS